MAVPSSSDADRERQLILAAEQQEASALTVSSPTTLDSRGLPRTAVQPPHDSFTGYEILREIHRGGQGVVYQARQKATRKKVAIKVMKEGPFAGPRDRARFEREVHILAQLRHPSIVAVHDIGEAAGCHFFVMDYISGQPLDVYMASGHRPVERTLELFGEICVAVNAAHLSGVIHRDLKPSNILIDDTGAPHILDFGLAKTVVGASSTMTEMTMTGQFIGSLPWASPEQAEGAASKIDIRSDVYSLGVVLYQMLTGRFPYEVVGNMRDVLDNIVRAEPLKPRGLRRDIDDEVETIVLKTLSKERDRRYQSAGDLHRDITRYLNGEPIEAKRDSSWYMLKKTLRRLGVPVSVAAAFLLLVVGFGIWMSVLYREADHLRGEAETATALARSSAAKAAAINRFLTDDVLAAAQPENALGQPLTIEQVIDDAARQVDFMAAEDAELEAAIRYTLGRTYSSLGAYDKADPHFIRALQIHRDQHGADDPVTLRTELNLGQLRRQQGRLEEAEDLITGVRDRLHDTRRSDDPLALEAAVLLAELHAAEGRYADAEATLSAVTAASRKLLGGDHQTTLNAINNLAAVYRAQGNYAAAEPLRTELVAACSRVYGPRHPLTLEAMNNLAWLYRSQGDYARAERLFAETLELRRQVLGENHPRTLTSLNSLAGIYALQGRYDAVEPLRVQSYEGLLANLGPKHPKTLMARHDLAWLYNRLGRHEIAARLYEEVLADQRLAYPDPRHPEILKTMNNLARLHMAQQRYEQAEVLLVDVLADYRARFSAQHFKTLVVMKNLGELYMAMDETHRAEPLLREAADGAEAALGGQHDFTGVALLELGRCLDRLDRTAEAEEALTRALDILLATLGAQHERTRAATTTVADFYARTGRTSEADRLRATLSSPPADRP